MQPKARASGPFFRPPPAPIDILCAMNLEAWLPFQRARFFMAFNRYARAIEGFERALQVDPRLARAAAGLGYAYAMLGRDELAIRHFRHAVDLDPGNAAAFFDLGFIYDRQGMKEEAIQALAAVRDELRGPPPEPEPEAGPA